MASTYDVGYLYCVGSAECPCSRVKIGVSADPESRLKTFQTGSPCCLEIKWAIEVDDMNGVEQQVHWALNLWRLHNEWFGIPEKEVGILGHAIRIGIRSGNMAEAIQKSINIVPAVRWADTDFWGDALVDRQEASNAESGN